MPAHLHSQRSLSFFRRPSHLVEVGCGFKPNEKMLALPGLLLCVATRYALHSLCIYTLEPSKIVVKKKDDGFGGFQLLGEGGPKNLWITGTLPENGVIGV